MTRHPTGRRVHREATDPDDVFLARLLEFSTWARQHLRLLVAGVIVLAIAIFAVVQYFDYRETMAERAAIRLLEVRSTAAAGNTALAARDLETFLDDFEGTPATTEARMLLAQLYLLQDQPQQAIDVIRPVTDASDNVISTAAGILLAGAYEAADQPDRAIEQYLETADDAEYRFQRREALEDAARLRVARGDHAGAIDLYDQLIELAPEDAERDVYRMRRTEVELAQQRPGS